MTATERGLMVRAAIQSGGGLLNLTQVAWLIGRNKSTTSVLAADSAQFPRPVAAVGTQGQTRVWLKEEVEAWLRHHPTRPTA